MKNETLKLIRAFISQEITATEFEKKYAEQWRKIRDLRWQDADCDFTEDQLRVLDQIFMAVDSYCSDDHLRSEGDLDDKGLLVEVTEYSLELGVSKFSSAAGGG